MPQSNTFQREERDITNFRNLINIIYVKFHEFQKYRYWTNIDFRNSMKKTN